MTDTSMTQFQRQTWNSMIVALCHFWLSVVAAVWWRFLWSCPWSKTLLLHFGGIPPLCESKISPVSIQFSCVWRHAKQLPAHQSTIWLLRLVPRSYSGSHKTAQLNRGPKFCNEEKPRWVFTPKATQGLIPRCAVTVELIRRPLRPWLQLRFECDSTTIRLRRIARACFHSTPFDASKKWTCQFFVVVVSVSQSYRSRIAIVI